MGGFISATKEYLFREPRRAIRDVVVTLGGVTVIFLALLYQELPQTLRVLLLSIGTLNVFSGVAELVPESRVRLAGLLRLCFFVTVLWIAVVALILIAE